MASAFVQTNGRVIAGEGDPTGGDALVTNLSLFPINSLYINNNTGKLWVRNEENSVVGDWVGASGGSGSSLFPETGTGTATGSVEGDLDGNTFSITNGGTQFLNIDPTTDNELVNLRAINATGGGNSGLFQGTTTAAIAEAILRAEFNGADLASILAHAESGVSSIVYTADTHTFNAGGQANLSVTLPSSFLRAFDATDDGNESKLTLNTTENDSEAELSAKFNDGVKEAQIRILTDATTSTITHTADEHIFNLQNFANNAAAVTGGLSVGALYYTDTAGEGLVKIVL